MELKNLPIFAMMSKRLDWLSQRQKVLSYNISNADTPRFRALDVEPVNFKEMAKGHIGGKTLHTTSPVHYSIGIVNSPVGGKIRVDKLNDTFNADLTGNTVSLEVQLMKVGETSMDYELTTNLYRKYIGMFKEALGRGR